ncbi:hypothetical protein OROHE_008392 [Orobanche hederae]
MHILHHQIMRAQKRNTKKRNAYTSMEIPKKVSFVDSRRAKYRHEVTRMPISVYFSSSSSSRPPHAVHMSSICSIHKISKQM